MSTVPTNTVPTSTAPTNTVLGTAPTGHGASAAADDDHQFAAAPSRALAVRTWVQLACVPGYFVAMLLYGVFAPHASTDTPTAELNSYAAGGTVAVTPFTELLAAALLVGFIGAMITTIRGRGAWLATIGSWFAALGVAGSALVAARHFYDIALAGLPRQQALTVLDNLSKATGPLPLLLITVAPLTALLLFAIASFRARYATIIPFALTLAFLVLTMTPLPEWISLVVGLVGFGWIAVRMRHRSNAAA